MFTGSFVSSQSQLEAALALCDTNLDDMLVRQTGIRPQAVSQAILGTVLFCLGFQDQALVLTNAAIAEAARLAHPPTLALNLSMDARLLALVGNYVALDSRANQLVTLATEQGFPYWRAMGTIYRGWVKVKNGDLAEGMCLLRSGLTAYCATEAELLVPYYNALLARACESAGQLEESLALLDEVFQIVERTGERWFAAELNRHKGQQLLQQGYVEAAEELYLKALRIAQGQEAKLWELRAAVSLGRLRRDQGRHPEARDLLASIYGWFTEGFDTPDLREAKALLDELA
jgi:predicted ATPase